MERPKSTFEKTREKVTTSKLTTISGPLLILMGALVPSDVRETCLNSIKDTQDPVLTGVFISLGALLAVIGPSLAQKKSSDSLQD